MKSTRSSTDRSKLPRARKSGLEIQKLAGEILVYDVERHRAHRLSPLAALVWQHCDGRTSLHEVARIIEKRLGTPAADDIVRYALQRLEKAHLLQTPNHPGQAAPAMSRRVFVQRLKKLGVAGASVALPVVSSIVTPAAAQAVSCLPAVFCAGNDCAPCFRPNKPKDCRKRFCCRGKCDKRHKAQEHCGC